MQQHPEASNSLSTDPQPLPPTEIIGLLESGDFSPVSSLLSLAPDQVGQLLQAAPFLISTLASGGYYREAGVLLESVVARYAPSPDGLENTDAVAMLPATDQPDPKKQLLFRIECDQAFINTMLRGDVRASVRRLRAAVAVADDPFSRAFAHELLGRVLSCGYATGFFGKGVMREMRAVSEESVELWQQAGYPHRALRALLRLADLYHESGELVAAKLIAAEAGREFTERGESVSATEGFRIDVAYRLLEAELWRHTIEGNAEKIGAFFREAVALVNEATAEGAKVAAITVLQRISRIAPSVGKDPAPLLTQIAERAKTSLNRSAAFQASQALGSLHFARGELVVARSFFEQALRFADRALMPLMQSTATLGLLQVTVHQGRFGEAAQLAARIEQLSNDFPITRTALGISVASILTQMGFIDRARLSCIQLLSAVRTQENHQLVGQVLFFLGHLNSVENNWSGAMLDWRAARKAHRQAENIDGHVMTLRALSQGALLEQPQRSSAPHAGHVANASTTPVTTNGLPAVSPARKRRAVRYLSAAEELLKTNVTSPHRTERLMQLGGITLAKAQLLIQIGDQKATLKTLGEARSAYQEAASGKDVALVDGLSGLVLLDMARAGNPLLFGESVASLARAAEFLECQQIVNLLWRVRYHHGRALFYWGGAETSPQTKYARWHQADYVMSQAADVLERLKTQGSPAPASHLDIIGSGVDESAVYDFGIELNERYLKSIEGAQRWLQRRN